MPFGLPFRPTPFRAVVEIELGGRARLAVEQPVRYRYVDDVFTAEKRMDLQVVPRLAVSMTPDIAIIPAGSGTGARGSRDGHEHRPGRGRRNGGTRPARGLDRGSRERARAAVARGRVADGALQPVSAGGAAAGEYRVSAVVENAGERFERGYQVIEYPHIERRHIGRPAAGTFKDHRRRHRVRT